MIISGLNLLKKCKCLSWTNNSFMLVNSMTQLRFTMLRCKSCDSKQNESEEIIVSSNDIPQLPDNCCMSGCSNCVWIQYAEELAKYYNDGGAKARENIEHLITDPNLKMFLKVQLKELEKDS